MMAYHRGWSYLYTHMTTVMMRLLIYASRLERAGALHCFRHVSDLLSLVSCGLVPAGMRWHARATTRHRGPGRPVTRPYGIQGMPAGTQGMPAGTQGMSAGVTGCLLACPGSWTIARCRHRECQQASRGACWLARARGRLHVVDKT
jgi:hypothetical protein